MKRVLPAAAGAWIICMGLCLQASVPVHAQCTGSPIFQETFGGNAASPEVGPPLPSSVTTYQYVEQGEIQDGQYSIKKTTGPMFNWFANGKDHTGNGYMMIVNASYDPGKFYEKEIDGLCQGSRFYFSAWIANLLPKNQYSQTPLDPAVRFLIRSAKTGDTLAQYATGTIPRYDVFTWTEYGMPFTLPAGESSLILTIFNDNPGGNGNDLALDDITFTLCGPAIHTQVLGTYQNNGQYACIHDHITLNATVEAGYYRQPVYQWQFSRDQQNWNDIAGATGLTLDIPDAQPTDSGWYRLLAAEQGNIQSPNCRVTSAPIPIFIEHPAPPVIQTNAPVCEQDTLRLASMFTGTYQWLLPDGSIRTDSALIFPNASLSASGNYALHLVTRGGCVVDDNKWIQVQANTLHVDLGKDTLLCNADSLLLNAFNPGATYQWNTGEQTASIWVKQAGLYAVQVSQGACQQSDSIRIDHLNQPSVFLGPDTTACLGDTFSLNAYSPLATTYRWQDGSDSVRRTLYQSGEYIVEESNACGTVRDTVQVNFISCAPELLVPNAFTPNGDGINDRFRPKQTFALRSFSMTIYDRWGNEIFHTSDPQTGWDGTAHGRLCDMGAYVWYIVYQKQNGKIFQAKGTVLLIR
ncbi:gliding motility-associated C-terminal domain-containing protein [Thermoflavifilum thermophilum]|uniref:Gliding motility-associated C-terminal domain-containing protein n=1 Tax=Thermoflavifilum thermophilum TaxID=1393122 RepID=A0A1I7MXN5_9BACT|nr:gliding motility-associated C-terminal domain-containing protein [Thermoflavifilum thermophilum]SFV27181.1 gliding motility-associated C-terminal domain-containing protein [Thermoflavifilum thermophilum]